MKSIPNFFANLRRKKQQKQYAEAHRDTIRSTYLLDKTTPFAVREAFRNLKASISVAIPKKEEKGGAHIMSPRLFCAKMAKNLG